MSFEPRQVWSSTKYPGRSIRLVRSFSKKAEDRSFEFRPTGWIVQGIQNGLDICGEYEITESSIQENFSNLGGLFFFFKRLKRLRIKVYYQ